MKKRVSMYDLGIFLPRKKLATRRKERANTGDGIEDVELRGDMHGVDGLSRS